LDFNGQVKMKCGIRIVCAIAALFAAAGNARAQSVTGTWDLRQVADKALPAVIEVEGDCREEIVSATLTLNADNTWRLERAERDVCGSKVEEEKESDSGQYRVSGTTIEFLDDDGKSQQEESGDDLDDFSVGTVADNVITVRLGKTETSARFQKR
jgi:hypothetical protein